MRDAGPPASKGGGPPTAETVNREDVSMSWLRPTKLRKADIPLELRLQFEQMGVELVSLIMSRHLEIQGNEYGLPGTMIMPMPLIKERKDRDHAMEWLKEQRSIDERRRDIADRVERWILILVGVEALPIVIQACIKCWTLLSPILKH